MSKPVPYETTIEIRDTCLCLHAQRAARVLARAFDEALRPAGLTSGQFSLLISLNRPAAPPIGPVARLLGMDRTTLTAALKPLEARGLVVVIIDPSDRRSRLLVLTDDGREVLAVAVPIWRRTHEAIEAVMPEGGADGLRVGFQALGAGLLGEQVPTTMAAAAASP